MHRVSLLRRQALFWEVEVPEVSFPDSVVTSAFELAKVYEEKSGDWIPSKNIVEPTQC